MLRDFIYHLPRAVLHGLAKALEGFARIGYAARGVVYLAIGWLAAAAAWSDTRPPSLGGTLATLSELPAGWVWMIAIALGLLAYAIWRFGQSLLDLNHRGWRIKGLLQRGAMLADAAVHFGIGILAAVIALGWVDLLDHEEALAEFLATSALDWPFGHWLLGLAGLCAIGLGVGQVAKAHRTALEDIDASGKAMSAIKLLGRIGLGARGLIFAVIGALLLTAAWRADASAAGGLRAALQALGAMPLGDWVLLAAAAALAIFGLFSLIKGWRHKKVTV